MNTKEITNCATKDCFKLQLRYYQSLELMNLIKDQSTTCSQKIKVQYWNLSLKQVFHLYSAFFTFQFSCFFAQLSMIGSWTDVHGNMRTYFSGDSGENICACGQKEVNDCYQYPFTKQKSLCNCDSRDVTLRYDEGTITNKVLTYSFIVQNWYSISIHFMSSM